MTPDPDDLGDTAFKRLWQTGFKGRFYNFTWPTGYTESADPPGDDWDFPLDFDNYADSEEIAYHVGAGPLKKFLVARNDQFPGKVQLMAHSMGGIVSSEALRSGAPVHAYAACQTAMVAHAYDGSLGNRPGVTWETPERYADYPPTGTPIYSGFKGKIFNFYNADDFALRKWRSGQNWKPNGSEGYGCRDFDSVANTGTFTHSNFWTVYGGSFPDDTFEIFAHCAEGRSFALGADLPEELKGNFNLGTDFSDPVNNFTGESYDHSGQFRANLMMRNEFWWKLQSDAFSITPSKQQP